MHGTSRLEPKMSNMRNKSTPPLTRQKSIVDSVARLVPFGHEKPLKQALYTTGSIAVLIVVCVVLATTYLVLQVFIKPLVWSMLCGSFLFPFKYTLHQFMEKWLIERKTNNSVPLFVEVLFVPLSLFVYFSNWLGIFVTTKYKTIISFGLVFASLYTLFHLELFSSIWFYITEVLGQVLKFSSYAFSDSFDLLSHWSSLVTLMVLTVTAMISRNKVVITITATALWMLLLTYLLNSNLSMKVPMLVLSFLFLAVGFFSGDTGALSKVQSRMDARTDLPCTGSFGILCFNSHTYFNALFFMFTFAILMINIRLITLFLVPFLFYILRNILLHEKTYELINVCCYKLFNKSCESLKHDMTAVYNEYSSHVIPQPLSYFWYFVCKGDRSIHNAILSSLPTITTIIIILIIFSQTLFLSLFLTVKVQQESFLAVQLASNVVNETVSNHPEFQAWLPDNDTMQRAMDSIVDKVYLEGREWISLKLRQALGHQPNINKIENQTLKIWDQLYHQWFTKNKDNQRPLLRTGSQRQLKTSHANVEQQLLDLLYMSEVMQWLQENLSSLMQVGEQIWGIAHSNLNLVMSVISAIFTILLQGGTMVLNFIVSLVIFFTTLFYLLSTSVNQYKPIEILGSFIKPLYSSGESFENAVQDGVHGVFGASLKMFSFYGIYTWINHLLFRSNLVYIPSVLAAVFGVVPLLTTYWVCLPSALELWCLQGSLLRAIGLCVFQFVPTFFVDAAIYQDISKSGGGGHPYITGLAVAGGVYTYGLQGAIFGPLMLCFLLVVANLYTGYASNICNDEVDGSPIRPTPSRHLHFGTETVPESPDE